MSQDTVSVFDIAKNLIKMTPHAPQAGLATLKALTLNKEKQNSIGALLEQQAEKCPQKTAIQYLDQSYSYAEFNAAANRIAHYLAASGIGPGDAVAVYMENRPEVLMAVAGIVKLGAIASMINTSQRGDTLIHSLTLVNSKRVIVGQELADAVAEVALQMGDGFLAQCLFQAELAEASVPEGMVDLDAELKQQPSHNPANTGSVTLSQPAYYILPQVLRACPRLR